MTSIYTTNRYKKDIIKATKEFKHNLIYGTIVTATTDLIKSLNSQSAPKELSTFLLESVDGGLNISAYGYVNSIMKATFKPKIHTVREWIPWTIQTTIVTTHLIQLIKVPIRNYYATGEFSMNGFTDDLAVKTIQQTAFNVAIGLSQFYLPPASKMGGTFARSTAIMTLGNLASVLSLTPLYVLHYEKPFSQILMNCSNLIPNLMFENALFSIISKGTDSLATRFLDVNF